VVKVDQDIDDAAPTQQLDPVVEKRTAGYGYEALGNRIRNRAKPHTHAGGEKQGAQLSSLHEAAALIELYQEIRRSQWNVADAPHLAGSRNGAEVKRFPN